MQPRVVTLLPPARQVTNEHMGTLSVSDINADFNEEPRIHDLLLAEHLGFKLAYDIRQLVKRNADELRTYGALVHRQETRGGRGRPTASYWLNEGQALLVCALARTTVAARVRRELITVFMTYRSGSSLPLVHVAPQVGEIAAMAEIVDKMRAEVNTLSRKVSALLGTIEGQGKALEIASRKAAAKLITSRVVAGPIVPPAALLYGTKAIATYINITERQVGTLLDMGRIPIWHVGKRVVCTTQVLDEWMAAMATDRRAPK